MHATQPSLPRLDHEDWFSQAPCLLTLFNAYAHKHGFRCTHGQIKHDGMHRHHVIFSDGEGHVFEAEADSEQLAAARAAERLILKRI